MYPALDDLEFLARSSSRVAVLDAVNDSPRTRDEVERVADASRTTVSRLLADFEERGWVERAGGRYRATPRGAFVASEVTRLLDNVATAERLDGALWWLPTDEFGFDLRRLRDAETVPVRWDDPASIRRFAERFYGAASVRSTATTLARDAVDLLQDLTVEQGGVYEGVFAAGAVETVRDHPVLREQLREMLESGRADVYRYRGEEPLVMVMIVDGLASVCDHESGESRMETVVSDDEAFRSWVDTYVDTAITESEPLDVNAFVP